MASTITIASLKWMKPERLSQLMLSGSSSSIESAATNNPSFAVVDVRDADHIGGNIKGSIWIPFGSLDYRLAELMRILKDKKTVVFHCAVCQERGPSAALKYLRERESVLPAHDRETESQEVFVLEGGFVGWQEKYGQDDRLTEKYIKDLWIGY